MAYLLRNANSPSAGEIMSQVDEYMNFIIANQVDGWLGPNDMPTNSDRYWAPSACIDTLAPQPHTGTGGHLAQLHA
jgi:hypothetical protein